MDYTPVPVIGPQVAEQIRSLVQPSGHLDLRLLKEIRATIPLQAPPLTEYIRQQSTAAVVGEGGVLELRPSATHYPRVKWISWRQNNNALLTLRAGNGIAPVYGSASVATGRSVEDCVTESQLNLVAGTAPATAGTVLATWFYVANTTLFIDRLEGLGVPNGALAAQGPVTLATSIANDGCSIGMRWSEPLVS